MHAAPPAQVPPPVVRPAETNKPSTVSATPAKRDEKPKQPEKEKEKEKEKTTTTTTTKPSTIASQGKCPQGLNCEQGFLLLSLFK